MKTVFNTNALVLSVLFFTLIGCSPDSINNTEDQNVTPSTENVIFQTTKLENSHTSNVETQKVKIHSKFVVTTFNTGRSGGPIKPTSHIEDNGSDLD